MSVPFDGDGIARNSEGERHVAETMHWGNPDANQRSAYPESDLALVLST